MGWWIGRNTVPGKRYRRRVLTAMSLYIVILFSCLKLVKSVPIHGWALYLLAVLPAVPVLAVLVSLARYLREESDEYLRMLTVRSLLVAAGAVLAASVVDDFLRMIAHAGPPMPLLYFIVFFVSFGIAQVVQEVVSREVSDE
jgi:peptidoglycan/LPS O-acetylase OafA/YrhL